MKRYFVENLKNLIQTDNSFFLEGEVFRYLVAVMRAKVGDKAIFFDETSKISAQIIKLDKRHCLLQKIEDIARLEDSPCQIHLGQVILTGDKMDFCLQKATELGVAEITPLYAKNFSQKLDAKRSEKKLEHWRKVILSACEQSGNDAIPKLNNPIDIEYWIENIDKQTQNQTKVFLDFAGVNWQTFVEQNQAQAQNQEQEQEQEKKQISILIGSAGGLSQEEVNFLKNKNWQSINLGKRILRGETASLAILTLLQSQWGDLKL